MTKLIKSIFHLIATFLIVLGIYGHHNNWSADDYKDFFNKNVFELQFVNKHLLPPFITKNKQVF